MRSIERRLRSRLDRVAIARVDRQQTLAAPEPDPGMTDHARRQRRLTGRDELGRRQAGRGGAHQAGEGEGVVEHLGGLIALDVHEQVAEQGEDRTARVGVGAGGDEVERGAQAVPARGVRSVQSECGRAWLWRCRCR